MQESLVRLAQEHCAEQIRHKQDDLERQARVMHEQLLSDQREMLRQLEDSTAQQGEVIRRKWRELEAEKERMKKV